LNLYALPIEFNNSLSIRPIFKTFNNNLRNLIAFFVRFD